ncbi:hypothetical protein JQ621_03115 [Bradyrhizobium manausense]|uniref:hypothetical protein n=1 Tax=Bradyrhizobium manausense TaxID=989370 RepID=UPI001BAD4243|nr:hypothetical protein [Bradyrhizobium manausense]MBR1086458.1 hypothetical protein [Bradyrhizobium manausense]
MNRTGSKEPGCALCWVDSGIWSKPVRGWDGVPICREHVAQSIAQANGVPVIACTVDPSSQSQALH